MNRKFPNIAICLVSVLFVFCSCSSKEYKLSDISTPLLDAWHANFAAADSSFSADNFYSLICSDEISTDPVEWYDYEPGDADWLIFSPNREYYLDLDYYSCLELSEEYGMYIGGDIDTKAVLVDVRKKKATDIIRTNCCNDAMDAFWVNNSVFVILGQSIELSIDGENEEWEPYISIWNKGNAITYCPYNGKINNFRDDRFFPFNKRLERIGITKIHGYNATIHYVYPKETIYSIAKQYNISQEELIECNPELKDSVLKAGVELIIPLNVETE